MPRLERTTVSLHYRDEGRGDPPLLFLHGWCDSSATWDATIAAFSANHRCLAPDMRGHGKSSQPIDFSYSIEALTGDAVAICEAAGASRPVVVGHSYGGVLAAEIARRFPGFARAVVVIDQPLDIAAFAQGVRPAEGAIRSPESHMAFREQIYRQLAGPGMPVAQTDAIVARARPTPPPVGMALWSALFEWTDDELVRRGEADMAALGSQPSLSIDHEDAGYHAALKGAVPSVETRVLPGGHWLHEERPAEFQAVLRAFLGRV